MLSNSRSVKLANDSCSGDNLYYFTRKSVGKIYCNRYSTVPTLHTTFLCTLPKGMWLNTIYNYYNISKKEKYLMSRFFEHDQLLFKNGQCSSLHIIYTASGICSKRFSSLPLFFLLLFSLFFAHSFAIILSGAPNSYARLILYLSN